VGLSQRIRQGRRLAKRHEQSELGLVENDLLPPPKVPALKPTERTGNSGRTCS
jgi:hypothetical protein